MFKKPIFTRVASTLGAPTIALFLAGTLSVNANAQNPLNDQYPELAGLLDAFDVAQGAMFDELTEINADPSTRIARNQLELDLIEMASMDSGHGGHGGHGGGGGHDMDMMADAPYGEKETASRAELYRMLRAEHSDDAVQNAFFNSEAIDRHTAVVLTRGRQFKDRLFEIYIDDSVTNKQRAVNAAVEDYLSDDRHSVAPLAKEFSLLAEHDQATAFLYAFPKLSGLQWANQWASLAALEAILVEYSDSQFRNTMDTVMERYWNKVGSEGGMTMFPAPVEQPTAAAIAPHLYSYHPTASIILDNLGMLENIIFDVLSYPNLENRQELIEAAVTEFTNKETNISDDYDYLLAALRGGIYNQGGPAVGELGRSERNRTREEMGHIHTTIMAGPQ